MTRKSARAGFTLIELVVVVAILGILAAIGVGAYQKSLDRARQKRTASDIRVVANAWESRATDLQTYLIAGYSFPSTDVGYSDLYRALAPTYSRNVPRFDGWGTEFQFGAGPGSSQYAIRSAGRDRIYEGTTYTPGESPNADCDIVFAEGSFVRYPAVVQSE